jgi:hypothetical protein
MSWNEAPRSKLRGSAELKPSELPEIFGGRFRSGPARTWEVRLRGLFYHHEGKVQLWMAHFSTTDWGRLPHIAPAPSIDPGSF